ncbi:MAG: hypothetical protein ACK56I_18375, partial [bacterium]
AEEGRGPLQLRLEGRVLPPRGEEGVCAVCVGDLAVHAGQREAAVAQRGAVGQGAQPGEHPIAARQHHEARMQWGQRGEIPHFVQPEPKPLRQPRRVDIRAGLNFGQQRFDPGDAALEQIAAVGEVSPQIGPAQGKSGEVQP